MSAASILTKTRRKQNERTREMGRKGAVYKGKAKWKGKGKERDGTGKEMESKGQGPGKEERKRETNKRRGKDNE